MLEMCRNTLKTFCLFILFSAISARQCYTLNGIINYNHELRINGTCLPCPYRCKQCISPLDCGQNNCQDGYYYDGKACQPCINGCIICNSSDVCFQCQTGYYINQGKCHSCYVGTATCSMSASLSCQVGYYFNNQTLFCQKCLNNCSQCQNSITCEKCADGSFLNNNNCESCSTNCISCSNSTICSKCQRGYQLIDGRCTKFQCAGNCKECKNTICTRCHSGYYLKNNNCQVGVSSLCLESIGPDFGSCQSCISWAYMPSDSITYCIPRLSATNMTILLTAVNNIEHFGEWIEVCERTSSKFTQLFVLNLAIKPSYSGIVNYLILFNATNNSVLTISHQQTAIHKTVGITNGICQNILSGQQQIAIVEPSILIRFNSTQNFSISEIVIRLKLCQMLSCMACSSETDCIKCQQPYLLLRNQCVQTCQNGYYIDRFNGKCVYSCQEGMYLQMSSYQCLLCLSPCLTCSGATVCKSCVQQFYLNNGVCVTLCPSNKTFAFEGNCLRCLSPCLTCSSMGDNCTSCMVGFLYAGKCVSECPEGTYSNFTSVVQCSPCVGCKSCQMAGSNCISCNMTTFLVDNKCLSGCPSGFCGDQNLRKCLACDQPCRQCQNVRWNCTQCNVGYVFNGSCLSSCPVGYYSDDVVCKSCPQGCSICSNATCCQSCQNFKNQSYYLQGCSCKVTCLTGYAQNNKCQQCIFPCATCRNTSGSNCTSCLENLYLHLDDCVTLCPKGFYAVGFICIACNNTCVACLNNNTCSECVAVQRLQNATDNVLIVLKDGKCLNKSGCSNSEYVWKNITSRQWICRQCDLSCSKCVEWSNKCLGCTGSLVYLPENYSCLTNCPQGYYISNMTCKKCSTSCRLCVNESTKCTACLMPMFLMNSSCMLACPVGMYGDLMQSICMSCPKQCNSCNSNISCNSCQPVFGVTYFLYNSLCVTVCPIGTIRQATDYVCQPCSLGCASCTNTKDNCTTCRWNLYRFLNKTYSCLESCPLGYYIDRISLECEVCKNPCHTCLNLTACLSCVVEKNQTYLYRQTCLLTCPSGTYQSDLTCQNCQYPCKTCTAAICLSCVNGLFYHELQCIEICPDKMYGLNNTCIYCSPPCINCLTATQCLSCIDGYFIKNGVCSKICIAGSYSDSRLGKCVPCSPNCLECQNSSRTCTLCRGNLKLDFVSMSCQQECPAFTYAESNSRFGFQCRNCSVLCGNCSSFSKCTSCRGDMLLQKDECVSQCADNYYRTGGTCSSCTSGCLKCNSSSCIKCVIGFLFNGTCQQACPEQYFQNHMDNTCSKCSIGCRQCISSLQCIECSQHYGLVQWGCVKLPCSFYSRRVVTGTICINECEVGQLISVEEKQCYESCPAHLIKRQTECLSKCPQNQYVSSQKQCRRCGAECGDLPKFAIIPLLYGNRIQFIVVFNKLMTSNQGSAFYVKDLTRLLATESSVNITKSIRLLYYVGMSLTNHLVVIESTLPFVGFLDTNKNPLQTARQSIVIQSYDYYGAQGTAAIGILVCVIVIVVYVSTVVFKISHLMWNTIEYCQTFFLLALLNQQFPTSLGPFLESFMITHWRFLPTVTNNPNIISPSPSKFHQLTTDISFLRNAGYDIVIFIVLCSILAVSWIIRRYGERIPKVRQYANSILNNKWDILLQFFILTVMNVVLFAAIQLSDRQRKDEIVGFSYFLAIFTLIVILVLSSGLIIQLHGSITRNKMCPERLISQMDMQRNVIGLLLNGYRLGRRVVIGLMLAAFPYEPMYLMSVAVIFHIVVVLTVYLYRPYVEQRRNKIEIIQQGTNIGVYLLLFVYMLNGDASITGKIIQGVIIQTTCCCLVSISLVIPCEKMYKLLRKAEEKKEVRQIVDESPKLQIEEVQAPVKHFVEDESEREEEPRRRIKLNKLKTFDASSSSS